MLDSFYAIFLLLLTMLANFYLFIYFLGAGRGRGLPHQCVSLERNDKLVNIKSTSKIIWEIT